MNDLEARQFIGDLYTHLLQREPGQEELNRWVKKAVRDLRPEHILRAFVSSKEYMSKRAVSSVFAPGHFHSPVVDPSVVGSYHRRSQAKSFDDLPGITINLEAMIAFWDHELDFIKTTPFTVEKHPRHRFFYDGSPYPWGDAMILRAMIHHYRPRNVIEIGSGFSTACMLDSADQCDHGGMNVTCIEPYPARLHSLMRQTDYDNLTIIPSGVQEVSIEEFDSLNSGDILFIDSTHVLKTGSDVHYELFSILPRLRSGVIVHIHDCPFPFEYPAKWVFDLNYSWNEAYALQAFLMYNNRFSIIFWNSLIARTHRAKLLLDYPSFLTNAGTSIWLVVNSD